MQRRSARTPTFFPPRRRTNAEWKDFYEAVDRLNGKLCESSLLNEDARGVYLEIKLIANHPNNQITPPELTKILEATREILSGPDKGDTHKEAYREALVKYHTYAKRLRRYPLTQCLVAAILCVIGAAIVVASGIVCAVSFGLATPISLFGIVIGASIIGGGIAIASCAAGAGLLMLSGGLFAHACRTQPIRREMLTLEKEAKRVHDVSTSFMWLR